MHIIVKDRMWSIAGPFLASISRSISMYELLGLLILFSFDITCFLDINRCCSFFSLCN